MTSTRDVREETHKLLLEGKGQPHPFSKMFPPISGEDFDKLVTDIEKNGLRQPIVIYQDQILDGNNRYAACMVAQREPRFIEFVEASDEAARGYVVSANIHRRHLTPDQRRDIIAELLMADPGQSNRSIAEQTKTSHHTVEDVREELEDGGQIAHQDETKGKDGATQSVKAKRGRGKGKGKGKGKGSSKQAKEMVQFFEVTNANTALNACKTLRERLLDALREVYEYTDLSQAEDCGRETIEKIEERLSDLAQEEERCGLGDDAEPVEAEAA